jgi:uncharacterized delta-60 repeat protein
MKHAKGAKWINQVILGCILVLLWGQFGNSQVERWVYQHPNKGTAYFIDYGSNDILYIAGYIDEDTGDETDFALVSLDTMGVEEWLYLYDGLAGGLFEYDEARALVYGDDNNVYAVGYSTAQGGDYDIDVISPEDGGVTERWIFENGHPDEYDQGFAIVYGDNNLYVAGYIGIHNNDFLVAKIDTAGTLIWPYVYNGTQNGTDRADAIVYGTDGNIYAAGYSAESGTNDDFTVISIDASGNERWIYTLDGSASNSDQACAIVYGNDGNIYAAGFTTGNTTNTDFTVISLDSDGNFRWNYTYNGPADSADVANALVYGADGKIYAAGYSTDIDTRTDFTVISIDPITGNNIWTYRYNAASQSIDEAKAIVYGDDDKLYAAGFFGSNSKDFAVVCLDPGGAEVWRYSKNGSGTLPRDEANSIVYGRDGNIYVAGVFSNNKFAVISLDPTPLPVIWVYPTNIYESVFVGDTSSRTIKIKNTGYGTLAWIIIEQPPANWLDVYPMNDSLNHDDSTVVTLLFDATDLAVGHYYDTLIVASNDLINPTKEITVHLNVRPVGVEETSSHTSENKCELLSSFFDNEIVLRFTKSSKSPLEINLYDILGTRVYETTVSNTPSVLSVNDENISRLSSGIYFISVKQIEKIYPIRKLVKP